MRSIILLHSPGFRTDQAIAGAAGGGLSLKLVCFWEQITDVLFASSGTAQMLLNGIPADRAGLIIFAGYPGFAVEPRLDLDVEFVQAEWSAVMNTFLHSALGTVANRRVFDRYLLYAENPIVLLARFEEIGWVTARDPGRRSPHLHLLVSRWSVSGVCLDSLRATAPFIDESLLRRTHVLLQHLQADFVILRLSESLRGHVLTEVSLVPPHDLAAPLWSELLRAILI